MEGVSDLTSDEIKLVLKSRDEPNAETGDAPRYGFSIIHIKDNRDIGVVCFSLAQSHRQYLTGHLSYGVDPAYEGHYFAANACMLMKVVARPIKIDDVPDDDVLNELKKKEVDMFVWDIAP